MHVCVTNLIFFTIFLKSGIRIQKKHRTFAREMSETDKNFETLTPAIVADDAVGLPRWYVAYVGTRAEKAVRDRLISFGYEAYAATQWEVHVWRNGRKKKIERPVITQYVFIRLTEQQRAVVVTMPEIHYFLVNKAGTPNEYGRHLPAVIPDSQMQMLRRMLGQSDSAVRFATSGFAVGDAVRVMVGGGNLEGRVVRIPGDHARYMGVRIDQLGCAYMKVSPDFLIKKKQ
jgi:transcription antitermination factor NusG